MPDYHLGRLRAPDERDAAHPMRAALDPLAPLPPYRYWIPTGVLDQNGYGVCVGAAWSGWLRTTPTRTMSGPDMFTIYRAAILIDEWADNDGDGTEMQFGTSVRAGSKVLRGQGRIGEYVWADSADTVARWLLTRGPVVVGTNWYEGMFSPDQSGYLRLTGSVAGGHAYLLLGYSQKREAFRMINSWSYRWGNYGRAWIAKGEMQRLLDEQGEACAAVEVYRGG